MSKSDLMKLSKSQLIKLLLQKDAQQTSQINKPIPLPRKSVKQMVKDYEENIILPPVEFRDDYKPFPAPRTVKPIPKPRREKSKPVPLPRTKITLHKKALKSGVLKKQKGFKFNQTLEITFRRPTSDRDQLDKDAEVQINAIT